MVKEIPCSVVFFLAISFAFATITVLYSTAFSVGERNYDVYY
jgi:hypothetical protein